MMARRLIPALLLALLTSGLFTLWLSKKIGSSSSRTLHPGVRVLAASQDIPAGAPLQPSALHLVDWPAAQPLSGSFQKPEEIAGRVLLFPLSAGEIVLEHQLAAAGAGTGLTMRIPEGMRAISLQSDQVAGVAGFLLPGSFIDVLVTCRAVNTSDFVTSTVLQDARVLAAGQKFEPDPSGKATTTDVVTLLVTPQDAEKVTLASTLGKIHFVLRNGTDRTEVVDLEPQISLSAAPKLHDTGASSQPRRKETVAAPARYIVQTISGGKSTEQSFEDARP